MIRLMEKMWMAVLLLLIVTSCTPDRLLTNSKASVGEEVFMSMSLNVSHETLVGNLDTRSLPDGIDEGTESDYQISDFWVIEYDDGGNQIGTARYFDELGENLENVPSIPVIKPLGDESYTLVFIANTHTETFNLLVGDITTLDKLKQAVKSINRLEDTYNANNDLLMNGTISVTKNTSVLDVTLYRNVAKLTLKLGSSLESGMKLTSVQVRSVSRQLVYADRLLDNVSAPYPEVKANSFFDYAPDYIEIAPGKSKELTYYLPRNIRGTTSSTTEQGKNNNAPTGATFVEILAENEKGQPMRYIFYLGANMTNDFNLVPNKHYILPITINSQGNPETDARIEDMRVIQLSESNCYLISPLNSDAQTVYCVPGIARSNRFWLNDVNAQTAGENNVIDSDDEWVAEVIWQDQNKRLIYFCDNEGKTDTEITPEQGNSYLGNGDNFFRFKPVKDAEGNVLVGVRKKTESGAYNTRKYLWSFHLWITSYAPDYTAGWYLNECVYPVKGGAVHRYVDKENENIWQTKYYNKYIMDRNLGALSAVQTDGIARTGGMYYQFGRKDPFPADNVKLYDITGTESRQFGTTTCIAKVPGEAWMYVAVQYPYNFYYTNSVNDWVKNNLYTAAEWNNPEWYTPSSGNKSLFDPSPLGWRLPYVEVWNVFGGSNNFEVNAKNQSNFNKGNDDAGYQFYIDAPYNEIHGENNVAFYPAAGNLYLTGTLSFVKQVGYLWTCKASGAYGMYKSFNEMSISTGSSSRCMGMPIRCVQE